MLPKLGLIYLIIVQFSFALTWTVDPDEDRDIAQLIESRGFGCERHYITTEDGYILSVFRMINPLVDVNLVSKKRPIVLQHGLLASGVDFLIASPGGSIKEWVDRGFIDNDFNSIYDNSIDDTVANNLGFVLANLGYDVWISNTRGNVYSRNHTHLDPDKDSEFWQFTFDEMVAYDCPAVINHVLKETKQETLGWVGHSQGTLMMFGLLASKPEYSNIVKPFIALAPVARIDHIKSPIRLLSKIKPIVDYFKKHAEELLPNSGMIKHLEKHICTPKFHFICTDIVFMLMGFDSEQLNMTRLPVYAAHLPAGTSTWNIVHFSQLLKSTALLKYDFGVKGNLRKYGSPNPPKYPLEKINSTNIALFYSKNDLLADPKDVSILKSILKGPLLLDYLVPFKKWNHMDFTYGIQSGYYINRIVIDVLRRFDKW